MLLLTHNGINFFIFLKHWQVTIALEKQDTDPEKRLHNEYSYAGGLNEYVKWLNADKVCLMFV